MGMTSSPVILGHETIYHKVSYLFLFGKRKGENCEVSYE